MVLAAWAGFYVTALVVGRVVLAVDTGTVGLVSACLSFLGAVAIALVNRGGRHGTDPALLQALAETQARAAQAERERDEARGELANARAERAERADHPPHPRGRRRE